MYYIRVSSKNLFYDLIRNYLGVRHLFGNIISGAVKYNTKNRNRLLSLKNKIKYRKKRSRDHRKLYEMLKKIEKN